jgi:ParB-like chromosome segregation protein Spo0J
VTKRGGTPVNAAAEWVEITSLVPWERNPVVHTNAEIEELRALVASSVWTDPLVARRSDRRIIAGHRRRLAALEALRLDPAWRLPDAPGVGFVPVRFVEVDDATAARLTIADNAMTKQSAWDDGELVAMLREIEDPSGLGFDDDALAAMLAEPEVKPGAEGAKELDPNDFNEFDHTCPKCGFGWT